MALLAFIVALVAIHGASTILGQQNMLREQLNCPSGLAVERLEQLKIVSGVGGCLDICASSSALLPQQAGIIACLSFGEDVEAFGVAEVLLQCPGSCELACCWQMYHIKRKIVNS